MIDFPLRINAKLQSGNFVINDVYSEIRFPKNDQDEIFIDCFPTNEQVGMILGKHAFSITGVAVDECNNYNKIIIEEARFNKILTHKIANKKESYQIIFHCMDLYSEYKRDNLKTIENIEGWFNISLLASIGPHKVFDRKLSGIVNILSYKTYKFNLESDFTITFDTMYFNDLENKFENQIASVSYVKNVAEFSFVGNFNKIEHYSKLLNDFLMLLSFAIRKRTVCTGWCANNGKEHVKYIKRNIVIPEYKDEHLFPDYLIKPSELKNFLESSFPKFKKLENNELIRRAIFPIPTDDRISTESYFLILFSCLESILLYHKKYKRLETIINDAEFQTIRPIIQKTLKSLFLNDKESEILKNYDSNKRKMVYQKISELNRPSFKTILDDFCSDYDLNLHDLWEITETKNGISLTQIRNKLIHGDIFPSSYFESIIIAQNHLRVIVERMILKVLDWDIEKTRVAPSKFINNIVSKENILKHMKLLNE